MLQANSARLTNPESLFTFPFAIYGDPLAAGFLGSSAIVRQGQSAVSALRAVSTSPYDLSSGLQFNQDIIQLQPPTNDLGELILDKAGQVAADKLSAANAPLDSKFWMVSIGLVALGLVLVLGGVLSFR